MNAPFDAEAFKSAIREQWDRHAKGWNTYGVQIGNWLREPTNAMLSMAEIGPGARVLDVAAGAGDQTIEILKRAGSTGFVLATDISPTILEFAKINAHRAGYENIETRAADGESLDVMGGTFDAAICRLGLMFFPNATDGLRAMYRALKPGGRACAMVFSTPENNPCVSILMSTALKHAGLPPRDPYQRGGLFSLGKPGLLDALFRQAGYAKVATTTMPAPFKLPSVKDYLEFVRNSASPILQILGRLDETSRQAAWAEIESKLCDFNASAGWEGPNELLLTVGRRE